MNASRMLECLETIRWGPSTLAQALRVQPSKVEAWISDREDIPVRIASWLEALCFTHEASDLMRPTIDDHVNDADAAAPGPRLEYIPAYSYGLLRQLNEGVVALRNLYGTEDEGAVFFLVSRGLAERAGPNLSITSEGRALGEVSAPDRFAS